MSALSAAFSSHARNRSVTFICAIDANVGAYHFSEGDCLRATVDNRGRYFLQAEWAEGTLGPVPAGTVNMLAGKRIVQDQSNFHWAGKR